MLQLKTVFLQKVLIVCIQLKYPTPQLTPYVKSFWGIHRRFGENESHVQQLIPTGLMELTFHLGDLQHNPKGDAAAILLSGQHQKSYNIVSRGHLDLFSIIFYPHAARQFFKGSLSDIQNQTIPATYFLRKKLEPLEELLRKTTHFEQRIALTESFLIKLLDPPAYHFTRMQACMHHINSNINSINSTSLADKYCVSRKQFERIFQDQVGTSPKQFLRIVRFQKAIHEYQNDKHSTLTSLAIDCGYYDQSHFNHEFKQLSGMTPRRFFSNCVSYSDYFL
jgi:AraC-like DNA-binding protein